MKQASEAALKTAIVSDVMMDDEEDVNHRVQPLVAQIGWTPNLVILQRSKYNLEREFYIRKTSRLLENL